MSSAFPGLVQLRREFGDLRRIVAQMAPLLMELQQTADLQQNELERVEIHIQGLNEWIQEFEAGGRKAPIAIDATDEDTEDSEDDVPLVPATPVKRAKKEVVCPPAPRAPRRVLVVKEEAHPAIAMEEEKKQKKANGKVPRAQPPMEVVEDGASSSSPPSPTPSESLAKFQKDIAIRGKAPKRPRASKKHPVAVGGEGTASPPPSPVLMPKPQE